MACERHQTVIISDGLARLCQLLPLIISVSLGALGFASTHADELIPTPFTVYTYHNKPPYFSHYHYFRESVDHTTQIEHTDDAQGLYPSFIELLNQSQQRWKLSLKYLPRKRLQLQLNQNQLDGAVIGVNPLWFSDKSQDKYLWSESFMKDHDVIAVRSNSQIKYTNLEDLEGLSFAVPRGWYFVGISEMINQNRIQSFETSSDIQNLKLIAQGRVDATVVSLPTLVYFQTRMLSPNALKSLQKPHSQYQRQWLFPQTRKKAFLELSASIKKVSSSAVWRQILHKKGVLPTCLDSLNGGCSQVNHSFVFAIAHNTIKSKTTFSSKAKWSKVPSR